MFEVILKKIFLISALTIALVHVGMFAYWSLRIALVFTLGSVNVMWASQIVERNDSFLQLRKTLSSLPSSIDGQVIMVARSAEPSRFELEVLYELYPTQPVRLGVTSFQSASLPVELEMATVVLSEEPLELGSTYQLVPAEGYYIYKKP